MRDDKDHNVVLNNLNEIELSFVYFGPTPFSTAVITPTNGSLPNLFPSFRAQ